MIIEMAPTKLKALTFKRKSTGGKVAGRDVYCEHFGHMEISEDTQLVTCTYCKTVISAYTALVIITKHWDRMKEELVGWKEMRAAKDKDQKAEDVRKLRANLQWVEQPGDDEPEARAIWDRYVAAVGKEPFAMFRRGSKARAVQYCIVSPNCQGYEDAEYAIKYAVRHEKVTSL
jgi:hypothetical protein